MENPQDPAQDSVASASFLAALIGDGRPLLALVGLGLILAGAFALFLSVTGSFLPQDVAFLGMDPRALCGVNQCRVVHFMFHDRVSFGGTLNAGLHLNDVHLSDQMSQTRKGLDACCIC